VHAGTTTSTTRPVAAASCLKGNQTATLRALTLAEKRPGVSSNIDRVTVASDHEWATTHVPSQAQQQPVLFLWWCHGGAWQLITAGPLDQDCNVPLAARNELGIMCTNP
jgi:hypothetical protein